MCNITIGQDVWRIQEDMMTSRMMIIGDQDVRDTR